MEKSTKKHTGIDRYFTFAGQCPWRFQKTQNWSKEEAFWEYKRLCPSVWSIRRCDVIYKYRSVPNETCERCDRLVLWQAILPVDDYKMSFHIQECEVWRRTDGRMDITTRDSVALLIIEKRNSFPTRRKITRSSFSGWLSLQLRMVLWRKNRLFASKSPELKKRTAQLTFTRCFYWDFRGKQGRVGHHVRPVTSLRAGACNWPTNW